MAFASDDVENVEIEEAEIKEDMEIVTTVYREGDDSAIPVVLLHAFPVDHRVWDLCAEALIGLSEEDDYPIFAPDMPGAGLSPVPTAELSGPVDADGAYPEAMDNVAASFVHALRDMGYSKAVWVGISMGGYVALTIQRLFPETVAGLVLCDTTANADDEAGRARRLGVARDCEENHSVRSVMHFALPQKGDSDFKKSDKFIRTFTQWIDEQSPSGVAWRQHMAAGRKDHNNILESITVPVAMVSGELDGSSNPTVMRPLADKFTSTTAHFYEIEDAGHFTSFEKPTEVAQAIHSITHEVNITREVNNQQALHNKQFSTESM